MKYFIEFMKIFASWPVITCVLFFIFKRPISDLILKLSSVTAKYKDTSVKIESQKGIEDLKIPYNEADILSKTADRKLDDEELKDIIQTLIKGNKLWEFKYLDYFLVPTTKETLHCFYRSKESISYYDNSKFPPRISMKEKNIIISVLLKHDLVKLENTSKGLFSITDKGREYIESMPGLH